MFKFSSLQPHNILLASKENSAPIKIADFGIATEIGEEGYVTSGEKNWMKLLLLAEVQLYVWFSPILQKESHVQTWIQQIKCSSARSPSGQLKCQNVSKTIKILHMKVMIRVVLHFNEIVGMFVVVVVEVVYKTRIFMQFSEASQRSK